MAQDSTQDIRPAVRATTLGDIIARLAASGHSPALAGADQLLVTGVTHDSRRVRPGDLYAALPGAHTHGAAFVEAVIAAGAAAIFTDPVGAELVASRTEGTGDGVPVIVVDEVRAALGPVAALIYGDPSQHLPVIGITGTNGKTTTTWLIDQALHGMGVTSAVLGTAGVRIGSEIIPSARTTPEAPDLQALLAVLRERGADIVAMEVSSHALALRRVDGTHFAAVGFTHLTQDHLDFHHSMEDYFEAKARLFIDPFAAKACIVVDDEWGRRLVTRSQVPTSTVTTVDLVASEPESSDSLAKTPHADWAVVGEVTQRDERQLFDVQTPSGDLVSVELGIPGTFNVANAVLALALIDAAGYSAATAAQHLRTVAVPGRMESIVVAGAPLGIVDYAHTPDAVERAVRAARHAGRTLVVVLGAGGDRDQEKRPLMGHAAVAGADVVIVTDDNPRSEDPAAIRGAVKGGALANPASAGVEVLELGDRRAAIAKGAQLAAPDGVVLVLGKGHETGQEVAGVVHPFDDRIEVRAALVAVRDS